jgi:hypothetical protein
VVQIEILIDGEGFTEVALFEATRGTMARELITRGAALGRFVADEAFLFVEDGNEPIVVEGVFIDESFASHVHHVHRAKHIAVEVFYMAGNRSREFSPATRIQRVLEWAVGPDGFGIDPTIAPEMELALQGTTTALPKSAHIGRFSHHPGGHVNLDLIRGVVPNG